MKKLFLFLVLCSISISVYADSLRWVSLGQYTYNNAAIHMTAIIYYAPQSLMYEKNDMAQKFPFVLTKVIYSTKDIAYYALGISCNDHIYISKLLATTAPIKPTNAWQGPFDIKIKSAPELLYAGLCSISV